jgi:hypothetical protein
LNWTRCAESIAPKNVLVYLFSFLLLCIPYPLSLAACWDRWRRQGRGRSSTGGEALILVKVFLLEGKESHLKAE